MCGGSKWKREKVHDHKFDFVDTREFTNNGFVMRIKYIWLYIIVLKSFAVYVLDVFTAVTMLSTTAWSNEIFEQCSDISSCPHIKFRKGRWLFIGCIIFSFLLLAYESRKAKKIIASRDISYAFTNVMANHYYSLRSYDHFCFFDHISNSTKISDDFAFFVFFTFKNWKQLLLADAPRQTINGLTLYAIYYIKRDNPGSWHDLSKWFGGNKNMSTSLLTVTTFLTVAVFAGSLLLLVAAGICYFPLLCHIRGNLKEYCCHKVDKRIEAVIKRRQKQRLAVAAKLAKKEARGDYSHLKNKKGEMIAKPLPQPTLPNLSIDDDMEDTISVKGRTFPGAYSQDHYHGSDKNSVMTGEYPPMPVYNAYSNYQNPPNPHLQSSSISSLPDDSPYQPYNHLYDEDADSIAHLTSAAAPFSQHSHSNHAGAGVARYDSHEVYQGRAVGSQIDHFQRRHPPMTGTTYDDTSEYSTGSLPAYAVQPVSSGNQQSYDQVRYGMGAGGYPARGY